MARWLRARAENALALMMAVMFASFIAQVAFRYLLNLPLGWTEEVCVLMWLWGILWGAAFVLRAEEEIRFDLLIGQIGPRARRALAALGAAAAGALLLLSLPATWAYVVFMGREKTAALHWRLDWVFGLYLVFVAALVVRQAQALWLAWRGEDDAADDPQ
ncbi:MAG: TRAP transporter small permease subunit [Burkholderiaceae bacterium]|nr:TRAP transporter small permease subunit [Burkholderiaceae bacterium]